jgi:hypothetical protein
MSRKIDYKIYNLTPDGWGYLLQIRHGVVYDGFGNRVNLSLNQSYVQGRPVQLVQPVHRESRVQLVQPVHRESRVQLVQPVRRESRVQLVQPVRRESKDQLVQPVRRESKEISRGLIYKRKNINAIRIT